MPRLSRTVFAGIPHHITQRGNRREDIFFTVEDREIYLSWLREYCEKFKVEILAYCLMSNHIHLLAVPANDDGLQRVLKPLHMRYAQRINRARDWKGHLWQGWFFSSPLDDAYLSAAVRYVERNPVRAGMASHAEHYRWSSAAAHCGKRMDGLLNPESDWNKQFTEIEDWSTSLAEGDGAEETRVLKRNVDKGLPCGSETFVHRLGEQVGRLLAYRPQGRPKKTDDDLDKG